MVMQINNGEFSQLDKSILNIIQKDFPVSSRPYLEVAKLIGSSEDEVLSRVKTLKEEGVIRRMGGVFDSGNLGFVSTLVALKVDQDKLEEVGEKVSSLEGVTHNYERAHSFNLWFTLVSSSKPEMEITLKEIENYSGVEKLRNLPALNLFKIGVNFKL